MKSPIQVMREGVVMVATPSINSNGLQEQLDRILKMGGLVTEAERRHVYHMDDVENMKQRLQSQ